MSYLEKLLTPEHKVGEREKIKREREVQYIERHRQSVVMLIGKDMFKRTDGPDRQR